MLRHHDNTAKDDFDDSRRSCQFSPEQLLLRAVLLDAIDMIRKGSPKDTQKLHAYLEAVTWIQSDLTDSVMSFRYICDAFHISPDAVRRNLLV